MELGRFSHTPRKFWKGVATQKKFFDWLMTHLGYKCMEDWYNVTQSDIFKNGGLTILHHYSRSPSRALQSIYPEHKWELDRFRHKPHNFWKKIESHKKLFDTIHAQLGYKSMDN